MAYLRDDEKCSLENVLYRAMSAELSEVLATLKRFRYGNIHREIGLLNKRACELQKKMEELQSRSPVRLG